MKFQNPILKCVPTDGWTYKLKAICPLNFSKVGGIINQGTKELTDWSYLCHLNSVWLYKNMCSIYVRSKWWPESKNNRFNHILF